VYVAETDEAAQSAAQATASVRRMPPGAASPVREAIAATGGAGPTTSLLARPGQRLRPGQATFCGSPDTVAAQLRCFRQEAGVGVVDLIFYGGRLPPKLVRRSIDLFAREVLPQIREL